MLPPNLKKTCEKWERNPHNVRKQEMIKVLTSLGCSFREGGDHPTFTHPKLFNVPGFYGACFPIALEHGRIVKPRYVKIALKVIEIITEEDC